MPVQHPNRRTLALSLALAFVSSPALAQGQQTVNFAFWGGQEELTVTQKLVEQFRKVQPTIDVKLQQIPSDQYEQKILTQIAGGTAPDAMVIRDASSSFFARRNLFVDLAPLMVKNKFDVGSLSPAAVKNYQLGTQQYGLSRESTPVLLYFNKALFDAAGVKYPTASWTWTDFLSAARKLTKDTNGDGKPDQWGTYMTPWDALFLPLVYSYGGTLLSPDGSKAALTTPATVAAFTFANDLINTHKVAPPLQQAEAMGWIDSFAQQKYAMIFQGRWATPIFTEAMTKAKAKFAFDVAPIPQGKVRKTVQYSSAVGVLRASKVPDAAYQWVSFLTSAQGQAGYGGTKSLVVPANLAVAKTLSAPNALPEHAELFLSEARYGSPPPQSPSFSALYEIVNRNLKEVFLGLKSVQQGLTKVDEEVNVMLKQARDSLQ